MNASLSASDYYAQFPIFKLDSCGSFLEANPATDVLIDVASGCRETIYGENSLVMKKIREANGDEAFVKSLESSFQSNRFGRVTLRFTIVKIPSVHAEHSFEITVYGEIIDIADMQAFVDELQQELQQNLLWETYAMSYDVVLPQLDYYQDVVNRHVRALSRGGVHRVLDIGAGTGSVTTALSSAGCRVTAIDVSRAMLERLRAKLAPDELKRVEILQGDAKNLSMLDHNSFDGVNILLALFDMSDPISAIHEAIRVLKRGGLIIITEPRRKFNLGELLTLAESCLRHKHLYEKLESDWKRVTQVNKKIDPSKRGMRLFIEDIAGFLSENGFYVNDIQDSHYGNCATILAEKQA
jgi:ubiquinone/menaquinone biosynthesis C-methylase UbiE